MIQSKSSRWFEQSTLFYNDPPARAVGESTKDTIGALVQGLPSLMQAINAQTLPSSASDLAAAKTTSPQYGQLLNELFKTYAPELAKTGSQIDNATRLAQATTDSNILKGPGSDLAHTTDTLDRQLNPEYYKTRADTGNALAQLLGSVNLDNPNTEAERLVNQEVQRSGNTGNSNATNTVANALSFGNEKAKRTATLSSAINAATQFLQGGAQNNNALNVATASTSKAAPTTGISQFAGVSPVSSASSTANNLYGGISGTEMNAQNINANRKTLLDATTGVMSSL